MREIKFRAWFKRESRWLSNHEYKIIPDGTVSTMGVFPSSRDIILMQFTGLHDKNLKEIYEGDIVKQDAQYSERGSSDFCYDMTYIGEVRIEASKGVVIANITCTDNIDGNTFKAKHRKGLAGYRAEVIGNIYEKEAI